MQARQFRNVFISWGVWGRLVIPFLCICSVFAGMFLSYRYNDYRNAKFAEPLFTYPLPAHTEVIEHLTECFCPPNGGTCDIVFRQTMISTLPKQQIKDYYHGTNIEIPKEWYIGPAATRQTDRIKELKLEFDDAKSKDNQSQFSISIGQAFYHPAGFDLRCTNL